MIRYQMKLDSWVYITSCVASRLLEGCGYTVKDLEENVTLMGLDAWAGEVELRVLIEEL